MSLNGTHSRAAFIFTFVVISCAIVGYFVGLQSPMNPGERRLVGLESGIMSYESDSSQVDPNSWTVLAADYSDMSSITQERAEKWKTKLSDLKSNVDLFAEISISPQDKAEALARRDRNRAFNGAPPTIPHPTNDMTSELCATCHTVGAKTESMRISMMSHPYLDNCTQCHVESYSSDESPITLVSQPLWSENSFEGLPAPFEGRRAFEGAPPQIPHSVWMRQNCSSCHGVYGLYGIRGTHPWRDNCQQCHVGQSLANQELVTEPSFLPPPTILN